MRSIEFCVSILLLNVMRFCSLLFYWIFSFYIFFGLHDVCVHSICVCLCWCVHKYMWLWMHVCIPVYVGARGLHQVSSSIALHPGFWVRISPWTHQLTKLANKLQVCSVFAILSPCTVGIAEVTVLLNSECFAYPAGILPIKEFSHPLEFSM